MSQQPANDTSPAADSSLQRPVGSSLQRQWSWLRLRESLIRSTLFLCALFSILTTLAIIFTLLTETIIPLPGTKAFFQEVSVWRFVTDSGWAPTAPEADQRKFGILPLVCGTFLITGIAAVIGLPSGLLIAIYLSEYASPRARQILKPSLELLAGVPTVVYGYFALFFLTPYVLEPVIHDLLGFSLDHFNALSAGIVVGVMIIPVVSSLSEDVLRSVPKSLREAGYALGATKFDVCLKVIVPAALSGIFASFLLALARAIGETMAVAIAAGQQPNLTLNPLRQVQTMTGFIVNLMSGEVSAGSMAEKSLYAVALLLFITTFMMNVISQIVLRRYREVYQ